MTSLGVSRVNLSCDLGKSLPVGKVLPPTVAGYKAELSAIRNVEQGGSMLYKDGKLCTSGHKIEVSNRKS